MKLFKKTGLFFGRSFLSILIGFCLILCLASGCDTKSQDTQKSSVAPQMALVTESIVPMFGRISLPPDPDKFKINSPESKVFKDYSRANSAFKELRHKEAWSIMQDVVANYKAMYPDDVKGIALLYERLGIFAHDVLRSQRANKDDPQQALEEALSLFMKIPGSEREIARCYHFLGLEKWLAGFTTEARNYFIDSAVINLKT